MKLSVIVLCFGNLENLKNTYNSIINQKYDNIEIIIVNDIENKELIAKPDYDLFFTSILKDNMKIIKNFKSQGNAFSWNIAKKYATGKYIWFLKEGDILGSKDSIANLFSNELIVENKPDVIEFTTVGKNNKPIYNNCLEKDKIMNIKSNKDILVYMNLDISTKIFKLNLIEKNFIKFRYSLNYNILFIYQFFLNAKTFIYADVNLVKLDEQKLKHSALQLLKQWPHIFNYLNSNNKYLQFSEELIYSFIKYSTFTYFNLIEKYNNKVLNRKSIDWIKKRVKNKMHLYNKNKYINYNPEDSFNPYSNDIEKHLKNIQKKYL